MNKWVFTSGMQNLKVSYISESRTLTQDINHSGNSTTGN